MANDVGGLVSAGSGLGVTVALMYLFWKFNRSTDTIYSRRAQDQVATIADLEAHVKASRVDLDECHNERMKMMQEVNSLKSHVERLEYKITMLESKG